MDSQLTLIWSCSLLAIIAITKGSKITNSTEAINFLNENIFKDYSRIKIKLHQAEWDFAADRTPENKQKLSAIQKMSNKKLQEYGAKINERISQEAIDSDPYLARLIRLMGIKTPLNSISEEKTQEIRDVIASMLTVFNKARVKSANGEELPLHPNLVKIMANSRNLSELLLTWVGWRKASGPPLFEDYQKYIKLTQEGTEALNKLLDLKEPYTDYGNYLIRNDYETADLESQIEKIMKKFRYLYTLLHTYAKRQLKERFGSEVFPDTGHIPAHLLGNMWAMLWDDAIEVPFLDKPSLDVTGEMHRQNYTIKKMIKLAESFFMSLGFEPLEEKFWSESIFERRNKVQNCQPSAYDMATGDDFRIMMCALVNSQNLQSIHHEIGHIMYFRQYQDLPPVLQSSPNPALHEAIGNIISLSVFTPSHLRKINLLKKVDESEEFSINSLFRMALRKLAFMPYGFILDKWRWEVYAGKTKPKDYNRRWWQLRCSYQGVSPPVPRTEDDFDVISKYHIPANIGYIRYVLSTLIQFQLHEKFCELAGYNKSIPLHKCSIYESKAVGEALRKMMKKGKSISGPEAVEMITGKPDIRLEPLLNYFNPLQIWLENYLKDPITGKIPDLGWSQQCANASALKILSIFNLVLFSTLNVLFIAY